jgi:hypothetical protein
MGDPFDESPAQVTNSPVRTDRPDDRILDGEDELVPKLGRRLIDQAVYLFAPRAGSSFLAGCLTLGKEGHVGRVYRGYGFVGWTQKVPRGPRVAHWCRPN